VSSMSKSYTEIISDFDTAQAACVCIMMSSESIADGIKKQGGNLKLVFGKEEFTVSAFDLLKYSIYFKDISKTFYTDKVLPEGLEFEFDLVKLAVRFAFDEADVLFFEPMVRRREIILNQATRFKMSESQFRFLLSNSRVLQRIIFV
ncbi:hypothetical protein, partial [Mesorhizobium sp. M7A.F.Ca.CA.004.12.1.1]